MTTPNQMAKAEAKLIPCPFCGGGQTEIRENGRIWGGMKYSEPTSVSVFHHCDKPLGQPHRAIERVGRDLESAIEAWNMRAAHDAQPSAELPAPFTVWRETDEDAGAWGRPDQPVFTADQMHAFRAAGVAEAQAEIEALRADAERYRWLRASPLFLGWEHDFRPDEVDREIDAARKGTAA